MKIWFIPGTFVPLAIMKKPKTNKMKIKTTVSDCYDQARAALAVGKHDKARDMADYGIVKCAEARNEGMGVDDTLDGVRIGLWLERFWYFLENNNLMLDGENA